MGWLLDRYKSGDGKSKYEQYAMTYLVDYMFDSMKTGYDKAVSLTPTNIEGKLPCAFVPSMFYTFLYIPPKGTLDNSMYDAVPLVLVTSFDGKTVSGLNFNVIPNDVRASILDILLDGYSAYYESTGEGNPVNSKLGAALINEASRKSILDIFSRSTGVNVSMAMRTYSISGIHLPRMIEYDMWEYIPYLSFKDSVRGDKLIQLQVAMAQANRR